MVTSLVELGEVLLSLSGTECVAGAPTGVTPMYEGEQSYPYRVNTPCPLCLGGRVVDTADGLANPVSLGGLVDRACFAFLAASS